MFRPAPPPAAFEAAPPPPFLGPPDSELGVTVPVRAVLASDPTTVIALTDCTAYSTGFEFLVAVRSREAADARLLGFGAPAPPGAGEAAGHLRITVRFADGTGASSGHHDPGPEVMDYYLAKRDGREPKLPRGPVLQPTSGGGSGKRWTFHYWVWPLPPPGKVTLACEWPARGIPWSEIELDGAAILRAGGSSTDLWPG